MVLSHKYLKNCTLSNLCVASTQLIRLYIKTVVNSKENQRFWENNKSEILKQLLQRKRVVNETNEIKCDFRYRSVSTEYRYFQH